MSKADEIKQAIGAHGMWNVRLKKAIETGQSEWSVAKVKADNNCDFGKWLHGLPDHEKKGESWTRIRNLHASFHEEAAKILDYAVTGKKEAAADGLELGSDFAKLSSGLTTAMMKWSSCC